jgi:DNA repair protein RadA/Sms
MEDSHGGHGQAATATMDAPSPSGRLLDIPSPPIKSLPISSSLAWFEHALGGMLVEGSTILISGAPGSSKSTVSTQACLELGALGVKSLHVLTEESPRRLLDRAIRLSSEWPSETVRTAIANMHCDSSLLDLHNLPAFLATHVLAKGARHAGCKLIVVDSIQADGVPASARRQYVRLFEFTRMAKAAGIATVLIAHETKAGRIAGPRGLEHHADQVLLLRKALDARVLFVSKNRYGPENVRGIQLALDSISGGLRPSPYTEPLTGIARTFVGGSEAEIQALITLPAFQAKPRIHAHGLPCKRVEQLLACVARVPGLDLSELSVSVNCMVADDAVIRAPQTLAMCMSIISTFTRKPIPESHVFIGEVDLRRAVRAPRSALVLELISAIEADQFGSPLCMVCPRSVASTIQHAKPTVEVRGVDSLDQAIRMTWGSIGQGRSNHD